MLTIDSRFVLYAPFDSIGCKCSFNAPYKIFILSYLHISFSIGRHTAKLREYLQMFLSVELLHRTGL